jgi:hypothetical protein
LNIVLNISPNKLASQPKHERVGRRSSEPSEPCSCPSVPRLTFIQNSPICRHSSGLLSVCLSVSCYTLWERHLNISVAQYTLRVTSG